MKQLVYKYETHLHTSDVSRCATSSAEDMVRAFARAGYAGIIVTDHFINEGRHLPADWSWEQKMQYFHSGYRNAAALGAKFGLDVFFGWEIAMQNAEDYLTYNLPLDFLLAHPEIPSLSLLAYSHLVRESGGLLVRAHPFRQAHYIPPDPTVDATLIDGVEVNNGLRDDPEQNNGQAWAFAQSHPALIRTSGTDIHETQYAGRAGMAFLNRHSTMAALAKAISAHEGLLIIEGELYDREGNTCPTE